MPIPLKSLTRRYKASGDLKTIENCAEVLLFTLDEGILSNIEIEDRMLSAENNDKNIDQTTALLTEAWNKIRNERPGTGDISVSSYTRPYAYKDIRRGI